VFDFSSKSSLTFPSGKLSSDGSRSSLLKNHQGSGAAVDAKGQEPPSSDGSNAVKQDQYNLADFGETYSDAKSDCLSAFFL
jgi:hypothetical protein